MISIKVNNTTTKEIKSFPSVTEAAKELNISRDIIYNCLRRNAFHKTYTFTKE